MIDRRILRFLASGVAATTADAVLYATLRLQGLSHNPAKTGSFVAGSLVSWTANRRFTWSSDAPPAGEAARFFTLYGTTLALNVGVHHLLIIALEERFGAVGTAIAFLGATATSAASNFLGQRFWVFRAFADRNPDRP